jgi:glycosyltransferase involved in cell wall biosynthesis
MNILMVTNTFAPHVGGVARSVTAFTEEYRRRGHRVLVIAPEFENQPENETDVIRFPAIQNFNGSDFSVVLPVPRFLRSEIEGFGPDVVHSHHPFLLGATAVRVAHYHDCPLIFTHHTMYERYTHYVPGDSPALKRFVIDLATQYANLCETVVAPSQSIAGILRDRGVGVPVVVIPTGVELDRFAHGNGRAFRASNGIPQDALVLGHVGRLAAEKNLVYLSDAVAEFLLRHPRVHFLVAGRGAMEKDLRHKFAEKGLAARLHLLGFLGSRELADAYHAMDAFVFASTSETQGMVLTEAMAAGVPVIAIDASGVRDVVRDGQNGRLLKEDASVEAFRSALEWFVATGSASRERLAAAALDTARAFSLERSADTSLALYEQVICEKPAEKYETYRLWAATRRLIATEWNLLKGISEATGAALQPR